MQEQVTERHMPYKVLILWEKWPQYHNGPSHSGVVASRIFVGSAYWEFWEWVNSLNGKCPARLHPGVTSSGIQRINCRACGTAVHHSSLCEVCVRLSKCIWCSSKPCTGMPWDDVLVIAHCNYQMDWIWEPKSSEHWQWHKGEDCKTNLVLLQGLVGNMEGKILPVDDTMDKVQVFQGWCLLV